MVFGIGAAELLGTAVLIGGALILFGWTVEPALWLALALAMSSTALVLPISGTQSQVGRAALAMLLFEDLALVPMLFLIGAAGKAASGLGAIAFQGAAGRRSPSWSSAASCCRPCSPRRRGRRSPNCSWRSPCWW